jgi:acetyl esterase/lipase
VTHLVSIARATGTRLALAAAALASAGPAAAQSDRMTAIPAPAQPGAIPLNTGPMPGQTGREGWHRQYGSTFVRNVTAATLTPFLPDPVRATGAAVIVAPGGGFTTLSIQNEGWDVAKALQARGVAAFVLKYRVNPTPEALAAYQAAEKARFAPGAAPIARPTAEQMMANIAPEMADARGAFALVRARAGQWHVDPAKIGMVGFSAGAMLTLATTLRDPAVKPAFIATIYGPLSPATVPADAPPLFVALAADDPLFGNGGFGLIDSWRAAKRPVEFHLFEQGGHGFGMYPKTTTSTGWFDEFARWMAMHGWIKPA